MAWRSSGRLACDIMASTALYFLVISLLLTSAGPRQAHVLAGYPACQSACNTAWVLCYSTAGLVAGTMTGGAAAPAVVIACNSQQAVCMAACAAAFLVAPTPYEGTMELLLYSDGRHGMCPPLDLQLSSGGQRAVTHTVLVDHPSQSTGDPSVGVQGGRGSRSHASHAGPSMTANRGGCGQQSEFSPAVGGPSGAAAGVQRTGRSASLPSMMRCVERIIARVSSMRATSDGEREAEGEDYGDGAADGDDMDDVEGDTEDEPSLQLGARNTGGGARTGVGRGRGKGNARVVGADEGGGTSVGRTYWSLDESLVLVQCKRDYEEAMAAAGHAGGHAGGTVGGKMAKRKSARQNAFEAVTDVMQSHSKVVVDSVDRASKRQCDVLRRQCDIMEREVRVQDTRCQFWDSGQRMLCAHGGGGIRANPVPVTNLVPPPASPSSPSAASGVFGQSTADTALHHAEGWGDLPQDLTELNGGWGGDPTRGLTGWAAISATYSHFLAWTFPPPPNGHLLSPPTNDDEGGGGDDGDDDEGGWLEDGGDEEGGGGADGGDEEGGGGEDGGDEEGGDGGVGGAIL
ncbi:hypothetical protein CBR_g30525 [Chara braunii]|uniref:Uncharacterized protein n=1 Tax=Chara braunii TaxID=69332 RepID=A0A388LCX0_CHABU|nr:hypothetical protein CBR_g30525 [Chara braunii]|eukprot:GBG80159.1 hypothetical protein CBR_g30525 [Chara braunii]